MGFFKLTLLLKMLICALFAIESKVYKKLCLQG